MMQSGKFLDDLAAVIAERQLAGDSVSGRGALDKGKPQTESYTRQLLDQGVARCAQKVGEEATEVVIAAVSGKRDDVVEESADLLYHLLVLLQSSGVEFGSVIKCMQKRHAARIDTQPLANNATR